MSAADPYIDDSIGDLRNLIGATSPKELMEREAQLVFANELDLYESAIPRTNDLAEVCAIHKHLFGNIYDWAGQIRTVDIRKNEDGSDFFLIVSKITAASHYVFTEFSSEDALVGLGRTDFIKRIAYYYDQLNYIHPFREGNGRTQRIFWSRVARDAGFKVSWDKIIGDENNNASRIATNTMDLSKLITMFDKIITEIE